MVTRVNTIKAIRVNGIIRFVWTLRVCRSPWLHLGFPPVRSARIITVDIDGFVPII